MRKKHKNNVKKCCQKVPRNVKKTKRRGPKNPEDPSKKFLKILDTGAISSEKHEMGFW